MITLVVGLVAVRLLVAWLGEERLGAFRVVSDWGGHSRRSKWALPGRCCHRWRAINRGDEKELSKAMAAGSTVIAESPPSVSSAASSWLKSFPYLVHGLRRLDGDLRLAAMFIVVAVYSSRSLRYDNCGKPINEATG